MKHNISRNISLATLAVFGATALVGASGVEAQRSKGRRNTAIGLGAVTAYGLLKGSKTVAIAGGLGTAYAYKRYRDSGRTNRSASTIRNRFGNRAVYDARGNRYAATSRVVPGRTYYNASGNVIGRA